MRIEEIQNLPPADIYAKLDALAPQVLNTTALLNTLKCEQRLYLAARTLNGAGLRIGDRVRLRGSWGGKTDPEGVVVEPSGSTLCFQVLRKDGQPHGEPKMEWLFNGYEKL